MIYIFSVLQVIVTVLLLLIHHLLSCIGMLANQEDSHLLDFPILPNFFWLLLQTFQGMVQGYNLLLIYIIHQVSENVLFSVTE